MPERRTGRADRRASTDHFPGQAYNRVGIAGAFSRGVTITISRGQAGRFAGCVTVGIAGRESSRGSQPGGSSVVSQAGCPGHADRRSEGFDE